MYQRLINLFNVFAGLTASVLLLLALTHFIQNPDLLIHPDNFINYQAGFIRRGLDGQILYSLTHFFNIDFLTTLKIYNISTLFIAFILIAIFKYKNKIPTYILLSMSVLMLYLLYFDRGIRKDHIVFIFILLQSSFFSKNLNLKSVGTKISFVLISIIGTLIHEVFFILTFLPIIIGFWIEAKLYGQVKFAQRLVLILPSTFLFILLMTIFVGSGTQADQIKNSYENLSYNLDYLNALFGKTYYFWNQNYNLKNILLFFMVVFLHTLFVGVSVYHHLQNSYKKFFFVVLLLGQMMILLFLSMISIDYGRWVFLCFFTVIVFISQYSIPKSKEYEIHFIDVIFTRVKYFPFFLFFILTMPHSHWNGMDSMLKNNLFIQLKNKFNNA